MAKIDDIEQYVKNKLTKESTIQELQGVFCMGYKQLLTHLKKSPLLFNLSSKITIDKEKASIVYYLDSSSVLYVTGDDKNTQDMLYLMRETRHNLYIRASYIECKNILQLIGTYIVKHKFKPYYVTIRSLYLKHKHLFYCDIDNAQLYRVNVNKVCSDLRKIGYDFNE